MVRGRQKGHPHETVKGHFLKLWKVLRARLLGSYVYSPSVNLVVTMGGGRVQANDSSKTNQ